MSGYVPRRMLPVPPPCARDCAGRSADCHARCCSWALYESIRGWIYAVNQRGRKARELSQAAHTQAVRADNRVRRHKHVAK